jgi:hypothetical protein
MFSLLVDTRFLDNVTLGLHTPDSPGQADAFSPLFFFFFCLLSFVVSIPEILFFS